MVISANPMIPVPPPQGLEVNLPAITPTPKQTGSFAPPAVSATAGLARNSLRGRDDLHDIAGCIRCGGNHREEVCQEKDPWEYIAPYYGSVDFGQGFFSIPVMDSDSQPIEQLNYAHITIETGEVTCRDIEHEFNVWADSMNINWRFFAKPVSNSEFRTRFPNAKSIDELAHFGKLFMKTVSGAVIRIVKWNGDIEPISIMEEAWFRIKGIPMKYRCKSTAFYVASMVGRPLALDKNYLRNFSYIRVKIGCQDLSLVPSTHIGEIRKAFFEFQFTRELPEGNQQPNNQVGNVVVNQEDENQQGTPKRQRIGQTDNGSRSAPPRVPDSSDNQMGRQRNVADITAATKRRLINGKSVISEKTSERVTAPSAAPVVCSSDHTNTLQPVHREVINSLAANAASGSSSPASPAVDPSFKKFMQTLASSGSDKSLIFQKKYK
jgi:hypothetical protein